jgi:hypothetical protein
MTHGSLSNPEWLRTVDRLGGAERLEKEAREVGAFERARKVKCAVDQLRLVMAYCWGTRGLRLTAAWAEAVGLVSLLNVALLKRLRKSADWLERLVCRLIDAGSREAGVAAAKGRPVRLVDATSVAKAGRDARESGGRWRIHSVFDLASERFTAFDLTDESEGEVIDRAEVVAGEIRVGDRAYLQPDRIAQGARRRRRRRRARRLEQRALARRRGEPARSHRASQEGARQGADRSADLDPRFGERAHRTASGGDPQAQGGARPLDREAQAPRTRQGPQLMPETLVAAEWVIIVTSLDRDKYPLSAISALYRLRGIGLAGPPGEDPRSAKAYILCHLLLGLLTEPLIAEHLGDSPRREAA